MIKVLLLVKVFQQVKEVFREHRHPTGSVQRVAISNSLLLLMCSPLFEPSRAKVKEGKGVSVI